MVREERADGSVSQHKAQKTNLIHLYTTRSIPTVVLHCTSLNYSYCCIPSLPHRPQTSLLIFSFVRSFLPFFPHIPTHLCLSIPRFLLCSFLSLLLICNISFLYFSHFWSLLFLTLFL